MWGSTSNNAVQAHGWNSYTHKQQIPPPKSSTESKNAPILKPEQVQLTASGEVYDNQQPGNEEEQAGADDD